MITSLVSKKGGVGKTTTAVCLAGAMAERGLEVLLVDLDSQASASMSLGVGRDELAPSAADVLLGGLPVLEGVRPTGTEGIDLLTGSVDLMGADTELATFREPQIRLAQALEPIADRYDLVLLDCPPSASLLPTNALVASDTYLIPVVPQFLAVTGVRNLVAYAERLRHRYRRHAELLGLVLTMVDYRNRTTLENTRRLRQEYGDRVFDVEIRVNVRLAEAPEHGRTIFQYAPDAPGAHAYRLLAEELLVRAARLGWTLTSESATAPPPAS